MTVKGLVIRLTILVLALGVPTGLFARSDPDPEVFGFVFALMVIVVGLAAGFLSHQVDHGEAPRSPRASRP